MGNDLVQITDYEVYLNLLIQQFQDKPKFVETLKLLCTQCEDIELAIYEFLTEFGTVNATGVQLDLIGRLVGLNRDGRDDESYRTLLDIKIEINFSAGTPEALIKTAVALYNATEVQYVPIYPAKVQLWQNGDIGLYLEYDLELDVPGDLMELDDGDTMIVFEADDIAEDLLYQIMPSGVGLLIASDLILDANDFLYLSDGLPEDHVIITEE